VRDDIEFPVRRRIDTITGSLWTTVRRLASNTEYDCKTIVKRLQMCTRSLEVWRVACGGVSIKDFGPAVWLKHRRTDCDDAPLPKKCDSAVTPNTRSRPFFSSRWKHGKTRPCCGFCCMSHLSTRSFPGAASLLPEWLLALNALPSYVCSLPPGARLLSTPQLAKAPLP
jgi:hypothetical protein